MMAGEDSQDLPPEDGLMAEATGWFGRMQGPEADEHRPAFEAWLARGALHRAFYNRASEIYSMGKFLKEGVDEAAEAVERQDEGAVRQHPSDRYKRLPSILYGILASIALLLAGGFAYSVLAPRPLGPTSKQIAFPSEAPNRQVRLSTGDGETLAQLLPDGSKVTLRPNSMLVVDFSASRRNLRLERGKSRFEVAHERRAFVVYAAKGTITARGTIFEVALENNKRVTVHLLRGKVDVSAIGESGPHARVRHMSEGEMLSYAANGSGEPAPIPIGSTAVHQRPEGAASVDSSRAEEFSEAPLGEVIAMANRRGAKPIRLADPKLAALKVSGRFRLDEPGKLASTLALIFDLAVDRQQGDVLLLRRR